MHYFSKGRQFCDFLFSSLHTSLLKRGLLYKERVDPFSEEVQTNFDKIHSPESVYALLLYFFLTCVLYSDITYVWEKTRFWMKYVFCFGQNMPAFSQSTGNEPHGTDSECAGWSEPLILCNKGSFLMLNHRTGTRKKGPYSFPVNWSSYAHEHWACFFVVFFFFFFFFVLFCLKLPQGLNYMSANRKGSGETALKRRLARAFAGRLCDKYPFSCAG